MFNNNDCLLPIALRYQVVLQAREEYYLLLLSWGKYFLLSMRLYYNRELFG